MNDPNTEFDASERAANVVTEAPEPPAQNEFTENCGAFLVIFTENNH